MQEQFSESKDKITVIHMNGSSDFPLPTDYKAWIDYWKEKSGNGLPKVCPCCDEEPSNDNIWVGAHVVDYAKYCDYGKDTKEFKHCFITPTCKSCNDKYKKSMAEKQQFTVGQSYLLDYDTTLLND